MRCAKCNYEFCWNCLGSYIRYRHEPVTEGNLLCFLIGLSKFLIIFMLTMSVLLTSFKLKIFVKIAEYIQSIFCTVFYYSTYLVYPLQFALAAFPAILFLVQLDKVLFKL